jgi:hypothetical protein
VDEWLGRRALNQRRAEQVFSRLCSKSERTRLGRRVSRQARQGSLANFAPLRALRETCLRPFSVSMLLVSI